MTKKATIKPKTPMDVVDEEYLENLWMGIGDVRRIPIINPMMGQDWEDSSKIMELITDTALNPEYMHFFIKYILNIDILPFQAALLSLLWEKPLPIVLGSRGSSKSFTLAIYLVTRAVLHQGCKIAVVGASLRQSMVLFNYIDQIWNNAPILREICGGQKFRPKKGLFLAEWTVGNSQIYFLPLGNGEKIRGQRANIVVADEFSCLDKNTIVETDAGLFRISDTFDIEHDKLNLINQNGQFVNSTKYIKTPLTNVYKITTDRGYTFKCSSIHKVKTLNGFKLAKDLTTDDYLLSPNYYQFPTKYFERNGIVLNEELAWLFGILTSEGAINDDRVISIQMTDKSIIEKVSVILKKYSNNTVSIDHRDSHVDYRGWNCKETWTVRVCDTDLRNLFIEMGLEKTTSHNKKIPFGILQSPKSVILSYLNGLFTGDGSCFHWKTRKVTNALGITYYSVSEQLCDDVHFILRKLDILGNKCSRKSNISPNLQWSIRLNGENAYKFHNLVKIDKWNDTVSSASRNISSADKNVWFDNTTQKWRCTYTYTGKTKSKFFNSKNEALDFRNTYVNHLDPVFKVRSVELLPNQDHLYDYLIPGDHSFMAGNFVQHNSINEAVFETVVRGFASTKSGGVFNSVVHAAKEKAMKDLGLKIPAEEKNVQKLRNQLASNQLILSGTPSYQFNHFYKYFKLYRGIILSGGDRNVLSKEFPELAEAFDDINVEDYAIFRLPYDRVPDGMMDKTMISQGRITMDPTIFNMEYGCLFPGDSEGFFLASYLHNATCPITGPFGAIDFSVLRNGQGDRRYVMGIDPAAEDDNFAICILELNDNYRGVVYIWTINRKDFEKLRGKGLIDEGIKDYHTFCIKHIRDLIRRFNIELICLDASGGGVHVKEGLKDPDKMNPGDEAILDLDDETNFNDKGRRILKMIQFSDAKWRKDAHYGLRKDILDKILLFPSGDEADFAINREIKDEADFDTIEDTYYEVLQCINETIMIQHNQTPNGTETWDVPRIAGADENKNKKKLKRDRFTSLLLANWAGRLFGSVKNYTLDSSVYTSVQRGKKNKSPSESGPPVNIVQSGNRKIFF